MSRWEYRFNLLRIIFVKYTNTVYASYQLIEAVKHVLPEMLSKYDCSEDSSIRVSESGFPAYAKVIREM